MFMVVALAAENSKFDLRSELFLVFMFIPLTKLWYLVSPTIFTVAKFPSWKIVYGIRCSIAENEKAALVLKEIHLELAKNTANTKMLENFKRHGFVHIPNTVDKKLLREALQEVNRLLGSSETGVDQFKAKICQNLSGTQNFVRSVFMQK